MDRGPRRGAAGTSRSASPNRNTASDATFMETRAHQSEGGEGEVGGTDWIITGEKTWNTGIHTALARPDLRPHQRHPRQRHGHHRVPGPGRQPPASRSRSTCGPSTCPPTTLTSSLRDVRVPDAAILGQEGPRPPAGAALLQRETASARAASSLGRRPVSASTARSSTPGPASRSASRLASNPGHPVPAGRAADAGRDAARRSSTRRRGGMDTYGPPDPVRQGVHVQLRGQPACAARARRPCHAGARRPGLLAAPAVSSTSTGTTAATASPRAPRRSRLRRVAGLPVRLHQAGHPQGRSPTDICHCRARRLHQVRGRELDLKPRRRPALQNTVANPIAEASHHHRQPLALAHRGRCRRPRTRWARSAGRQPGAHRGPSLPPARGRERLQVRGWPCTGDHPGHQRPRPPRRRAS